MNQSLLNVKNRYLNYLTKSLDNNGNFKFTLSSKSSSFSLVFGIFGLNLLKENLIIDKYKSKWVKRIKKNLFEYKELRSNQNYILHRDKPFLQLLTFSLSALKILDVQNDSEIDKMIIEIFPKNFIDEMNYLGVDKGLPGSGNFAMFYAIIILNNFDSTLIDNWISYHVNNFNKNGFWGNHLNHLSFQNGYHQYEIFKYLNFKIDNNLKKKILKHLLNCSDKNGHFAPYPGGGACFDYDAVFLILFCYDKKYDKDINDVLNRLRKSLINEQNDDGGFCENKYVRPFKLIDFVNKIFKSSSKSILKERILHFIFLVRPKNSKITNHWCDYSRRWSESNLWDSWFRMQTLVLINIFFKRTKLQNWGFIKFPGIGYYE